MDKKMTTTLGIALGASLLAGAGYGIYKFFSSRRGNGAGNALTSSGVVDKSNFINAYLSNSLIKSDTLYGLGHVANGLVGGGLYKTQSSLAGS